MNQITHPITKKKLNINSIPGKKVLKQYIETFQKGDFNVMEFNIWQEGTTAYNKDDPRFKNGVTEIANVIAEYKPEFVCIIENRNRDFLKILSSEINKINSNLNYYSFGITDTGILSLLPIDKGEYIWEWNKDDIGSIVKIEAKIKEQIICIYSAHLDYHQYVPFMENNIGGNDWKCDKKDLSPEQIKKKSASTFRVKQIETFLKHAKNDILDDKIVIIGGDFNEPPNLSVYNELIKKGFVDSYREKYNNKKKNPGYTVDVHNVYCNKDTKSRIDFIFYNRYKLELNKCNIIGPTYRGEWETRQNDFSFLDIYDDSIIVPKSIICNDYKREKICWPSDHKALLSEFKIKNIQNQITTPYSKE